MVATLVERFNSGKVSAMLSLYSPETVLIANHLGGSASDILRRGADGLWRYLIDNNQGTAVRRPA